MAFFVGISGVLQVIGGLLTFLSASTAMHQILAAVAFGMGTIAIGVAAMLRALTDLEALKAASAKQTEFFETLLARRNA